MLAIVIPYYKIDFFDQGLASLAAQTDKRFNVYIGNDASLDNPEPVIEKYKNRLHITYKYFKENLGGKNLVAQWNRCCRMINDEEWMMIMGDDDRVSENFVAEFYKLTAQGPDVNLIRFATVVIDDNNNEKSARFGGNGRYNSVDLFYKKSHAKDRSSLSEHIFKTKIFLEKNFRPYKQAWHSDDMAWLDFTNAGNILLTDAATVYIRESSKSISGTDPYSPEKEKASFDFYSDVLKSYSHTLSRQQLYDVLYRREMIGKKLGLDENNFDHKFYSKYGMGALFRYYKRKFLR